MDNYKKSKLKERENKINGRTSIIDKLNVISPKSQQERERGEAREIRNSNATKPWWFSSFSIHIDEDHNRSLKSKIKTDINI